LDRTGKDSPDQIKLFKKRQKRPVFALLVNNRGFMGFPCKTGFFGFFRKNYMGLIKAGPPD